MYLFTLTHLDITGNPQLLADNYLLLESYGNLNCLEIPTGFKTLDLKCDLAATTSSTDCIAHHLWHVMEIT